MRIQGVLIGVHVVPLYFFVIFMTPQYVVGRRIGFPYHAFPMDESPLIRML